MATHATIKISGLSVCFFGLSAQASTHSTTLFTHKLYKLALSAIILKLVDFLPLSIVDVEYCQWKNKETRVERCFVTEVCPTNFY